MSTCYTCGRHIEPSEPSLRRRVRTGDRTRVSFRTGKVVEGVTTYGQRTVCKRCAARMDRAMSHLRSDLLVLLFLLLLIASLRYMNA